MRKVYSDQYTIAHLWAHQLQGEARNSSYNFYFEGNTIYSYGSHFPCGKIVTNRKGHTVYILNDSDYSITTSKHKSIVESSVPLDSIKFRTKGCKTPYVLNGKNCGYAISVNVVLDMCDDIVNLLNKQKNARTNDYSFHIATICNDIARWIKFWELDKRQKWHEGICSDIYRAIAKRRAWNHDCKNEMCFEMLWKFGAFDNPNVVQSRINDVVETWFVEYLGFTPERIKELNEIKRKIKQQQKEEERRVVEQELVVMELWHIHERNSFHPSDVFYQSKKWKTALRVCENCIETSQGIKLNFEEGYRLWKIIAMFEAGSEFRHNIALDINGSKWAFNRYENHVLYAGCHSIPFSECEYIANKLGWLEENV